MRTVVFLLTLTVNDPAHIVRVWYEIISYSGGNMTKQTKCPCTGVTLTKLIHPVILTILADESLHGYRIAELASEVSVLGGNRPDTAGIYHVLRNMEESGYVKVMREVSNKGPARKTYCLTTSGRRCLETWISTLLRYHKGIGSLLEMARRAQSRSKSRMEKER
jgi:DNA-binding PadR family transcriptional regulator